MANNPMIQEVNRLIGNLLAGGESLFLPEVGSLYTERVAAKRLSRREIRPPYRTVQFSSQARGESLVELIAGVIREAAALRGAEIEADAQAIYMQWLAAVREGESVRIEGVGTLKQKSFTPDAAFEQRLNPQGRMPIRIKTARGFDWALWVGVVAIVAVMGFGGYQYLLSQPDPMERIKSDNPIKNPAATETIAEAPAPAADTLLVAVEPTSTAETPAVQPEQQAVSQVVTGGVASLTAGQRYVVLGVFSSEANATRAAEEAAAKMSEMRCAVYYFGEKFMVSPFVAADAEACTAFIGKYADSFPGMWTYTAR